MPELPEAETIRRGLEPLVGRMVISCRILRSKSVHNEARKFRSLVSRRRIKAVGRRGKVLLINLGGEAVLVVRLGMSGQLIRLGRAAPEPKYTRLILELDDGNKLAFCDLRNFGYVRAVANGEEITEVSRQGLEPLSPSFSPEGFAELLQKSRQPIKVFLLNQERVSGLGNIYANETLFLSHIHPRKPANSLDSASVRLLWKNINRILQEAIGHGGTTFSDYRRADGSPGEFQERLRVYGRAGKPCLSCGVTIQRLVLGGRSCFVCPSCQPFRG